MALRRDSADSLRVVTSVRSRSWVSSSNDSESRRFTRSSDSSPRAPRGRVRRFALIAVRTLENAAEELLGGLERFRPFVRQAAQRPRNGVERRDVLAVVIRAASLQQDLVDGGLLLRCRNAGQRLATQRLRQGVGRFCPHLGR